jgi:putative redox protein
MESSQLTLHLEWNQGLQFQATSPSGNRVLLDGDGRLGISPMESLLMALCGCMATDVVIVLQKMHADFHDLKVTALGERNPEPPRFFRRIQLVFSVTGSVRPERVEHAVHLSFERYCSVFHSLRTDIDVTHSVEVVKAGERSRQ